MGRMEPTLGRAGCYELREKIADSPRGPMFLGRDPRRRLDVLIQRFTAPRAPDAWARYTAAVAAARRAAVTGVELPLELVADDPVAPFAVLALRVGESVEALRRRSGALQWSRAAELVLRCADILAAIADATGQSHRAMNTSTLWLAPGGELSLLDLGVAELGPSLSPPRDEPLFVEYRAPEQLTGGPGDARSDVFTLGVLLCELSSGVHPFSGPSGFQAARKVLLQTLPSLSDVVRGMSPAAAREAERLIGESLAPGPDDRFKGAAEFHKALEFARRIIGSPAWQRLIPAAVVTTPAPQARPAIDDPSTMLRIPRIHVIPAAEAAAPLVAAAPLAAVAPIVAAPPPPNVPWSAPDDNERTVVHERRPAKGGQQERQGLLREGERTIVHERAPAGVAPLLPHDPNTVPRPATTRLAAIVEPTLVLPGPSGGAGPKDAPIEVALSRVKVPARRPQPPAPNLDRTLILPTETAALSTPEPRVSSLLLELGLSFVILLIGLAMYLWLFGS
jgi:hypothetical protein